MDQGMYTAAAGAMAMEVKLSVIANNLANANTVGFKSDQVTFEKYLRKLTTDPLVPVQYKRVSDDVISKEYFLDTSQGSVHQTGNPLDVSISGDGYFVVNTPQGARYTRAGDFTRSTTGQMTDMSGNAVQGEGGEITLNDGQVKINEDGTVVVNGLIADKLKVVSIAPENLVKTGSNLFDVKPGTAPAAIEAPRVQQGTLENSNVDTVKEMMDMILTQRAYDTFQKMIRTVHDAYGLSIRNVGGLS